MHEANVRRALSLARSGEAARALELTAKILEGEPECPYLLVLQAVLIQAQDTDTPFTLRDAEASLLRAVDVEPGYLLALEELAHYYDAVEPDADKARSYARRYLERGASVLAAMREIAEGSEDTTKET
jgi:hypothetical protein